MNVYDRIKQALAPLNIPVVPLFYAGKADVYAVIHQLTDYPAQSADGREQITGQLMQIDFVSKRDIREMVARATELLIAAHFGRRGQHEEHDQTSGTYRFCVRVSYFEEV